MFDHIFSFVFFKNPPFVHLALFFPFNQKWTTTRLTTAQREGPAREGENHDLRLNPPGRTIFSPLFFASSILICFLFIYALPTMSHVNEVRHFFFPPANGNGYSSSFDSCRCPNRQQTKTKKQLRKQKLRIAHVVVSKINKMDFRRWMYRLALW